MRPVCILLFVLVLAGCKKEHFDNSTKLDQIQLPVYSESGKNTFGFLMNDTVWTVFGKSRDHRLFSSGWLTNTTQSSLSNYDTAKNQLFSLSGDLTIVEKDTVEKDYFAELQLFLDFPSLKTYYIKGDIAPTYVENLILREFYPAFPPIYKTYTVTPSNPFAVEITKLDTVNKMCSGRFYGMLYLYGRTDLDSLNITDGRFDVKYLQ